MATNTKEFYLQHTLNNANSNRHPNKIGMQVSQPLTTQKGF